jgi:Ala-tRNA(Pro) deacylase
MPVKRLKEFLDGHDIKYVSISHSPAYSAQTIAESAHIPGKELAKTVIEKINDEFAMVILPASYRVHLGHLKAAVSASHVELATETELENLFPDCERGAMPPFGNLYDMDVYVAEQLTENDEIAFSAGSHTELNRMSYKDFERLVTPKITALT